MHNFTRENLTKLHELSQAFVEQKNLGSELLRTAQDRYGHVEVEIEREGEKHKVAKKVLWDEVFYLGTGCEAGKILHKDHPEVFEAFKKQDEMADELKKFCHEKFAIDFTAMTISDYLKMTEGMFNLLVQEKNTETGGTQTWTASTTITKPEPAKGWRKWLMDLIGW